MADSEKIDCTHPAHHHMHICQLQKEGLKEELAARTDNPGFICHNCNAVANRCEDLCNCSPFAKKA